MPHALATVADLEARLGRDLTPIEANRAQALLGDASSAVRSWTRLPFALVADDEVTLRPVHAELRLPGRPVHEVSSVAAVGCDGDDITLSGWCWDGNDIINLAACTPPPVACSGAYRAIYTHGDDTVPDEVVRIVCQMVNRTLTAPSMSEGLVSERIGQYNYQMQQGSGSVGSSVRMLDADKDALAAAGFRRRSHTVQARM